MSPDFSQVRFSLSRADFPVQVDLKLPVSGISVLFGPSGAGKTSVLRCVAGLERARDALIRVGGQLWQDDAQKLFIPTWQRSLGYVFQEPSLFPHLTVLANLSFGSRRGKAGDRGTALDRTIALLGIGELLERMPQQLSGGERQRVAIARALATNPGVLLLDEPMASLDYARRQEILPWLEKLRDELSIPMLYVTHSADEMARLADFLVVMDRGRVVASGNVADVLTRIDTPVLVGDDAGALISGEIAWIDKQWKLARVGFDGGSLWVRDTGLPLGYKVRLRVLARDVSVATAEPLQTSIQNLLQCQIETLAADIHESQLMLRLKCGAVVLLARLTRRAAAKLNLKQGSSVWAQVKSVAVIE